MKKSKISTFKQEIIFFGYIKPLQLVYITAWFLYVTEWNLTMFVTLKKFLMIYVELKNKIFL